MIISRPLDRSRMGGDSPRIDHDKSLPLENSILKIGHKTSGSRLDQDMSPSNLLRFNSTERTLNFVPMMTTESSAGGPQGQASTGRLQTMRTQNGRNDQFMSTIGGSKASLLGTRQSDFFADIEQDAELLMRFRDAQRTRQAAGRAKANMFKTARTDEASATLRDDLQLSKIRFTGLKTQMQGFTGRSKESLLKANQPQDLKQLTELFRDQNMKDLRLLEGKALDLTQELNSITARNEKKQKVLYQLEETYERLMKETMDESSTPMTDVSQSMAKATNLEENYVTLKNQETRLNQIIEICNVNKNQNDEWLRQLGYYNENLKKCIEDKRTEARAANKEAGHAEANFSQLKNRFKASENNTQGLLNTLEQIQADNSTIQNQFMFTERLIKRSLETTKKKLEDRAEDRLKQIEENNKERAISAKNREIQKDLNVWKSTMEKYSDIFENGEGGEQWPDKPEIKDLLENLTEKKELEKELMQLAFELKEKKMKNLELKRRIEVGHIDTPGIEPIEVDQRAPQRPRSTEKRGRGKDSSSSARER